MKVQKITAKALLAVALSLFMVLPMIVVPMAVTTSAAVPTAEEIAKTTTYISTDFEDQTVGNKLTPDTAIKTVPSVAPIKTEEGHGKFVRIPYIGAETYANDSNWDQSVILKNPASSWKDGYLTISADFRPHYDSTVGGTPLIEAQLSSVSYTKSDGTTASLSWISFFQINLKTGALTNTLGGTRGPASNLTVDAWNSLQIVLDLSTGTYNVVVNGALYAYNCNISNGSDDASVRFATLYSNTLILAKVNKQSGAYQTDTSASNYSYIDVDNVAFRTATKAEKELYTTTVTDGKTKLSVGQTYKTQDNNKLRIPFVGTATAGSGSNGSGNYDKATTLSHPVISSAAGSVVFEAKYYPHYADLSNNSSAANYCGYSYSGSKLNPTVEIQAHGKLMKADGTVAAQSFLSFGAIDVKSGAFNNGARGGTNVTGAAGFVNDQWNTLKIVIELSTGTFDIYINGHLYAYNCPISNTTSQLGYYMSINANSFIIAKTNKNTGAYLHPDLYNAGKDYSYVDIDDISLRPLTQEENSYMLNFENDTAKSYGTALSYSSQEITYNGTSYGTWRVPTNGSFLGNPDGFDRLPATNATTYSVTTIAGQKCLKIPFEGFCIMSSGAPYNVGGNADHRIYSSTPGYSWATTPNLVFEADYYLSAAINPFGVIIQFTTLTYLDGTSGKPVVANEATICAINAKNGDVYCLGGGTKTGAANLVTNSWNKLRIDIDMVSGTYNVTVNGNLYATGCRFNNNSSSTGYNGTNFASRAEALAIFKGGKIQGNSSNVKGGTPASENGYWENSSQYVAMDNLQIYMPTETTVTVDGVDNTAIVGNAFTIEKSGNTFVSAVVTDSTGTRTIYTDTFTVVGETTVTATWKLGEYFLADGFEDATVGSPISGKAENPKVSKVYSESGNKFVRVPFIGGNALANDSNWDRSLQLNNKAVSSGDRIFLTARYRPHFSSTYDKDVTVQAQIRTYYFYDIDAGATRTGQYFSLFQIHLKDGSLNNEGRAITLTGAPGLVADEWNDIAVLIDTSTARCEVYVNGLLYMYHTVPCQYHDGGWKTVTNFSNLSIPQNGGIIVAKCNKTTGAYAPAGTNMDTGDYSYIDVDDADLTKETDNLMVTATINGEDTRILPGTSLPLTDLDGRLLESATVLSGDATVYTQYNQIVVNGDCSIQIVYTKNIFTPKTYETINVSEYSQLPADYSIENGYIHVPYVSANSDKSIIVNGPAPQAGQTFIMEADFRFHVEGRAQFQFQITGISPMDFWISLATLNWDGSISGSTPDDSNYRFTFDEWHNIRFVIDQVEGTYVTFIDNTRVASGYLTITGKSIDNSGVAYDPSKYQNATLNPNYFIFGKVEKNSTWGVGTYADYDNVSAYYIAKDATYTLNGATQTADEGSIVNLGDTFASGTVTYAGKSAQPIRGRNLFVGEGMVVTTQEPGFTLSTYEGIISLLPGASIRLGDPTGMRFESVLDKALIDDLKTKVEAGIYPGVISLNIGTLIAPTAYVEEAGAFTKAALETLDTSNPYLEVLATYGEWFDDDSIGDDYYPIAGSIASIQFVNYTKAFSAISFVELRFESGNGIILYSNYDPTYNSRSVAYVASRAAADEDFYNSIPTYQKQIIEVYQKSASDIYSDLNGLTVLAIGDSLFSGTYGEKDCNGVYQWINKMGYNSAWRLTNLGRGGTTVSYTQANVTNKTGSMSYSYLNEPDIFCWNGSEATYTQNTEGTTNEDVQLIIFEGGCNDYGPKFRAPLGTVDSTDIGTFLGAWNTMMANLLVDFPNATIVMLTPWELTESGHEDGTRYEYVNEGIKSLYETNYADNDRVVLLDAGDPAISGVRMADAHWFATYAFDAFHLNRAGMALMEQNMLPHIWKICMAQGIIE